MNQVSRALLIHQSLTLFVEIVLLAIALALLIPISVLFIECSAALLPRRRRQWQSIPPRPKVDVLVPAHNEEAGIGPTLKILLAQLTGQDRLVVVADNCDDKTADIARAIGAIVLERHDPERRGKGYALDYGLQFLAAAPAEVVVVVDADCIVHPGAIDRLASLAATEARPVQATYLLQSARSGPRDAISALAFMVKNLVRPSGLDRIGLPCLLTGTGIAFPWPVIREAALASGNIVEDMQLSLDLAMAGHAPILCLDAKVTGLLPQQQHAIKSQRTRWEHGHLQLLTKIPQLLREAMRQKRFDLLAIAFDLCVPPLSLLVMIWAAVTGVAFLVAIGGASWIPATLLALEGLLILVSIVGVWAKFGRSDLPLLTLLAVPLYVLWKIPLYLAFLVRPQTEWVRTERDVVNAPEA